MTRILYVYVCILKQVNVVEKTLYAKFKEHICANNEKTYYALYKPCLCLYDVVKNEKLRKFSLHSNFPLRGRVLRGPR